MTVFEFCSDLGVFSIKDATVISVLTKMLIGQKYFKKNISEFREKFLMAKVSLTRVLANFEANFVENFAAIVGKKSGKNYFPG